MTRLYAENVISLLRKAIAFSLPSPFRVMVTFDKQYFLRKARYHMYILERIYSPYKNITKTYERKKKNK